MNFSKPGKGFSLRTKLYNPRTEKVWERTFKSSCSSCDILEQEYQYLYSEGANFIWIESFEQIEVDASLLGRSHWLEGEEIQNVLEWRSFND